METLRKPLEDRKICIVRERGEYEFPAEFLLVAAMNETVEVPIQLNDRVRVKVA